MEDEKAKPETTAGVRRFAQKHGLPDSTIPVLQDFLQQSADAVDSKHVIPAHLTYTVFPIFGLRRTDDRPDGAVIGGPNVQGTAAMLTRGGLFCTAAHCVNVAFGEKDIVGQNAHAATDYALHVFNIRDRAYKFCKVLELCVNPQCDVAVGLAEPPGPSAFPYTLGLGSSRLGKGAAVLGIGYPQTAIDGEPGGVLKLSMKPRCYRGNVDEWASDLVAWNGFKASGYKHSVRTPPGFSGGPFIRKRTNLIHGIMSGGFDTFGGPYWALDTDAFVDDWKISFLGDISLREFARKYPRELTVR